MLIFGPHFSKKTFLVRNSNCQYHHRIQDIRAWAFLLALKVCYGGGGRGETNPYPNSRTKCYERLSFSKNGPLLIKFSKLYRLHALSAKYLLASAFFQQKLKNWISSNCYIYLTIKDKKYNNPSLENQFGFYYCYSFFVSPAQFLKIV